MASIEEILIAHNRFGYGIESGETPARDPRQWLADQIDAFDATPAALAKNKRKLPLDAFEELKVAGEDRETRRAFYDTHRQAVRARIEAARVTETPFIERLVHFWANHFAISTDKKVVTALASSFEFDALRPHVTGNFLDLLVAAETHPAMLIYLDQSRSIGPNSPVGRRRAAREAKNRGLNENLAREILELHTMGARSGYTQADVVALAKALTGYTVSGLQGGPAMGNPGSFFFDNRRHEPGSQVLLSRTFAQSGQNQARAMMTEIVAQPATSKFIATKLARHFIADDPPRDSVERIAAAFSRSNGDLATVYRALISEPAAWRPGRAKLKSPWEWVVSALRTSGISVDDPMWLAKRLEALGQHTWEPKSPAGFPDTAKDWLAPDALLRRADCAFELAANNVAPIDARAVASHAYLGTMSDSSTRTIAAAGDPDQGLALFLMTPEFLWR